MNGQPKPLTHKEELILKDYLKQTYEYFLFNRFGHDGIDRFRGIIDEFRGIRGKMYHNDVKEDINFKYIWDTILRISEFSYLSHLVNIFDNEYYAKKGKKIYNIVFCRIANESQLIDCGDIITKIHKARNKILDHIDSNSHTYNSGKTLSEVFGLDPKGKDVQSLFDKTFELLKMKGSQKVIEEKMKEKFKDWYGIFEKGYPKEQ